MISMHAHPVPENIVCCYLYIITQYGYPPAAQQTIQYLRQMQELGFSSVELEGIREEHLLDIYNQRRQIRETIDELELKVPYFCAVLPGLGSDSATERKANLALFKKGCETAEVFNALGILDNAPLPPYQFPADIPVVRHYEEEVLMAAGLPRGMKWKEYWKGLISTYREACDMAAGFGLSYQMHPCAGVLSANTDAFLYFADAVNRPNLRFNLDTANQFFLKDNLMLSLLRLEDHIDYIHLSDNGGHKVEHLVPGDGVIHWDGFFQAIAAIGFEGHYGIDVGGAESTVGDIHEAYIKSAEWLKQRVSSIKAQIQHT
jgi:sugar phosphate isomerase/epimerase